MELFFIMDATWPQGAADVRWKRITSSLTKFLHILFIYIYMYSLFIFAKSLFFFKYSLFIYMYSLFIILRLCNWRFVNKVWVQTIIWIVSCSIKSYIKHLRYLKVCSLVIILLQDILLYFKYLESLMMMMMMMSYFLIGSKCIIIIIMSHC